MHGGAARWLCYGSMTRARYSLERSSALLVSWLSIRAFVYAVPSTDRCIFRMCSKRCMRGRASAVFWWLAAASRSAMIGIHPGRITTYFTTCHHVSPRTSSRRWCALRGGRSSGEALNASHHRRAYRRRGMSLARLVFLAQRSWRCQSILACSAMREHSLGAPTVVCRCIMTTKCILPTVYHD